MQIPGKGEHSAIQRPAPLAWAAALLCAGALVGGTATVPIAVGVVASLLALVTWGLLRRRPATASLALAVAWLATGVSLVTGALRHVPPGDLSRLAAIEPRLARVVGVVQTPPRPAGGRGESSVLMATVESANGVPATGRLRVRISEPGAVPPLAVGDRLELFGRLARAGPPGNPGEVDFAWLDAVAGVGATLDVEGAAQVTLLAEGRASGLSRVLGRWRSAALRWLEAGLDSATERTLLLRALLLGEVDPRLAAVRQNFQATGTTHHLAVSGTHIAVVSGFVFGVLRTLLVLPGFAWLTPRRIAGMTLGVVLVYGLSVAPGEPVTRSLLLATIVLGAVMTGRPVSIANLLGLCCVAMVATDPLAVFRPGFQLTFLVVWALIVPGEAAFAHLREYRDRDFAVVDSWRPDATGARWRRWKWKGIHAACSAGVAWIAASPIVAHHFGLISPWAAISSVVLSPVVFGTIVVAGIKTVLTALLPFGAAAWGVPADAMAGFLRWSVGALARAPASSLGVPPLPGILAIATIAMFAAVPLLRAGSRPRRSAAWALAAAACLATPFVVALAQPSVRGLRMTVLSVGSAQCIVIEVAGERPIIVDAGGAGGGRGGDVYGRILDPYLRARAIRSVGPVVVTHADADHTSGLATLLARRHVEALLVGEPVSHNGPDASPAGQALAMAAQHGISIRTVGAGDTLRHGPLTLDILHPASPAGLKENDASLVCRLTFAGKTILLTGDIEAVGQLELLRQPAQLRADIVLAPHHGSYEEPLPRFLAETGAATIIASDDATPSGKQLRTYREFPNVLRTSQAGAITVEISPRGQVTLQTFRNP